MTDTGRIRAKSWHDPRRKLLADKVKALQDAGPGKIKVNIVIEDGKDHRKAEGRRRAYNLDSGQPLQVDGKWVRDLIFYFLRTPPGPIRKDNHLVVAQIRNRINWSTEHRPQTPARNSNPKHHNQELVSQRKLNNAVDHRCFSQGSLKNPCAPADRETANGVKSVGWKSHSSPPMRSTTIRDTNT